MRFSDYSNSDFKPRRDLDNLFEDSHPKKSQRTMLSNSEIRKAMTVGLEISERESELALAKDDYLSVPN